jgi:hypothetical protein
MIAASSESEFAQAIEHLVGIFPADRLRRLANSSATVTHRGTSNDAREGTAPDTRSTPAGEIELSLSPAGKTSSHS